MSQLPADTSCITIPGSWTHRYIQANGAQFHIAHMGTYTEGKPLVLLLHGFPEYWWAWRNQIPAVAEAGYEVAAVDCRGQGGSDKVPDTEDSVTLSEDVAAIIRSLGYSQAVVVGLGRGGSHAWSAASMHPELIAGLLTVSAPHPRTLQRVGTHVTLKTWKHAIATAMPALTKRGLKNPENIKRMLREWSAPDNDGALREWEMYSQAMQLPGSADIAVDQLRWTWTGRSRPSGRKYMEVSANPIFVPVCAVRGERDPLLPARAWDRDREFAKGPYKKVQVKDAGHFVPEEQPAAFTKILLDFLESI